MVEFFETPTQSVLEEIERDLTERQFAQLERQVARLEKHGRGLGPTYFTKVAGVKDESLWEFRISVQDKEYRLLYGDEQRVVIVLCGYEEKRGKVPPNKIEVAKVRLRAWRLQRVARERGEE